MCVCAHALLYKVTKYRRGINTILTVCVEFNNVSLRTPEPLACDYILNLAGESDPFYFYHFRVYQFY